MGQKTSKHLIFVFAQVVDGADAASRLARLANVAPVQDQQWCALCLNSPGTVSSSFFSTSSTFLPGARPVRLATRNTWVSTAMVGWPNAALRITLAVLCPRRQRFQRLAGLRHHAAVLFHQLAAGLHQVFALGLVKADALDVFAQFFFAEFEHRLRCVGNWKQLPRAALTLTSVACARAAPRPAARMACGIPVRCRMRIRLLQSQEYLRHLTAFMMSVTKPPPLPWRALFLRHAGSASSSARSAAPA